MYSLNHCLKKLYMIESTKSMVHEYHEMMILKGDFMKRQLKVKCHGQICEEAKMNYHKILARIIVNQYGVEFAKELLEELKKEESK